MTQRLVRTVELAAGVVGFVAISAPDSAIGRRARRLGARLTRDARYVAASTPGIVYRLSGRRPDPHVPDDVLTDRVRSTLGPLERRLDVPRVHVLVEDGVALLHGDVGRERDACLIERAVKRVSGITGVESHLHRGLVSGDTRPSAGRAAPAPPSAAMRVLVDAATGAGAQYPVAAVHAVLCGFADRLPADERAHVFAHLPADVRDLAGGTRRAGARAPRLRTVPQLVAAAVAEGGIETERAEEITRGVVAALRGLVVPEARDVAAVLPADLRELWETEPAR